MFEAQTTPLPVAHGLLLACAALLAGSALVACGSQQTEPAAAPPAESTAESPGAAPAEPTTDSAAAPSERPKLTAEECSAQGGTVVGDIGDGAIHRPDYRCPSGAAPSGSIQSPSDGPVAVEGSVCCPG